MIPILFLVLLASYAAVGLAFAIPFILFGVKRIDRHAAHGSWGFRLMIVPGSIAFWPLLLRRWVMGNCEAPEECTAHRRANLESS